jgi:hypothetical protein
MPSKDIIPTNFGGINRQDAKFAKVDLLMRKPPIFLRSWRLGGEILEVCCFAEKKTMKFRLPGRGNYP